jgi:hypothetical protein
MDPKIKNHSNAWGQIIAKAWADEKFKTRLLANPAAVLKEQGLKIPPGCQVKIVEDTDKVVHLTLPAKSSTDELSEDELENIAGGTSVIKTTGEMSGIGAGNRSGL